MAAAGGFATRLVAAVGRRLREVADPARAAQQAKYMRDQFPFLGASQPECRAAVKAALDEVGRPWATATADPARVAGEEDTSAALRALWAQDEREFASAGVLVALDFSSAVAKQCRAAKRANGGAALSAPVEVPGVFVETLRYCIVSKSWWDTVDALASNALGPLVRSFPDALLPLVEEWVDDDESLWVRRAALLHQLRYGADANADTLFRHCELRMHETDFFMRKAVGWALRTHARVDPDAVRAFVSRHMASLSPLSVREALKKVGPGGGEGGGGGQQKKSRSRKGVERQQQHDGRSAKRAR